MVRPEAISVEAPESEATLPPTDLLPVALDSLLPTLAAAAHLPDRWTVKSTQTVSSVHAVVTSLVEVEAPVPALVESSGSRLDESQHVVSTRDNFDIDIKKFLPLRLRQMRAVQTAVRLSHDAVIGNETVVQRCLAI